MKAQRGEMDSSLQKLPLRIYTFMHALLFGKLPPQTVIDTALPSRNTCARRFSTWGQISSRAKKILSCPRILPDLNRPMWILSPFFSFTQPSATACHARLALD